MSAEAERRIDNVYQDHFFDGPNGSFWKRAEELVASGDLLPLSDLVEWQYQHAADVFCWASTCGSFELTPKGQFFVIDDKRYLRIEGRTTKGSLVVVHQDDGKGSFDGRFFLNKRGSLERAEITEDGQSLTVNFAGDRLGVEWSKFK